MNKEQITIALICLMALLALFFPTSFDGTIYPLMCTGATLLLTFMVFSIGLLNRFARQGVMIGLIILIIPFFASLFSPWSQLTFGAVVPYLFFVTVFTLKLPTLNEASEALVVIIFKVLSAMVQTFALLMVFDNGFMGDFNYNYYKAINEDLFEGMILWYAKPVAVFASHSIAGYMYFAFAITHMKLFLIETQWQRLFEIISILAYMALLLLLTSNTGLFLFFLVIALGGYNWFSSMRQFSLSKITATVIVLPLLAYGGFQSTEVISEYASSILSVEGAGFLARYTGGGRLQPTYDYLADNPLRPIGFTYDARIELGDNLVAEYIVRGGVQLYAMVLLGLVLFLMRNLKDAKSVYAFSFFFLLGDIGFPLLTYFRTPGLLIMFMVVWNFCVHRFQENAQRQIAA